MRIPLVVSVVATISCVALEEPEPSVAVTVTVARATFAAREPVGVNVTLVNTSDKEVILGNIEGGSLRVRDLKGNEVYPYPSRERAAVMGQSYQTLTAAQRRTERLVWPGYKYNPATTNGVVVPVDPGEYEIVFIVREQLNGVETRSAPVRVRVLAPES